MAIRARLKSGEIVELKKDCGCLDSIHTGPHWLHMDDFDKAANGELIEIVRANPTRAYYDEALIRRVAELEIVRLKEKRRQMEAAGIIEIIRETTT